MAMLIYINEFTDLDALFEPYKKVEKIKTIHGVGLADLAIYQKYEKLFIDEVSAYIASQIGEVDTIENVTSQIRIMGLTDFHSCFAYDISSLLAAYGLGDVQYNKADEIFNKNMNQYGNEAAMIRYDCIDENLYDRYIMSL